MCHAVYRVKQLEDRLSPAGLIRRVIELPDTDSTNLRLKEDDHPPGTLLYTLNQRAGRGRLGREWNAPPGSCLAMSMLLPPSLLDEKSRPLLPLCTALAVCEGLSTVCERDNFTIKWPNDILCNERKICGILCEHSFFDQEERTVCGMGINLTQTMEEFARQGLPYAGSLAMLCPQPPPVEEIIFSVSDALARILYSLRDGAVDPLLCAYAAHSATLGHPVRVITAREEFTGMAQSLAKDGALVIDTAQGTRTVCAGEVSVRGLYGYLP